MLSRTKSLMSACWRPLRRYMRVSKDDSDSDDDASSSLFDDPLFWARDIEKHFIGDFSFAGVQANAILEDYSQVETGRDATFIGVYDGHGGADASRYICRHLFHNLIRLIKDRRNMSEEVLRSAFSATEDGFLSVVRMSCGIQPLIQVAGSCCLVGVIWEGTLYVANAGDSRAVIGSSYRSNKIIAEQLNYEHNANKVEVREELWSLHPNDPNIVVMKHGTWRVKGIIQVSRSIGDAYLKKPEFSLDSSFPRFHLREPIQDPVLSAEPSLLTRVLKPSDRFLIFASDGLWEHMTSQEAVDIVHKSPRLGCARRLVKKALKEAARKGRVKYEELKYIEKGDRRAFHDDITVVVVFIDHDLLERKVVVPDLSVQGFVDTAPCSSKFSLLRDP